MKMVYLDITSWVGTCAVGAQHYYGRLKWRKEGKRYDYEELSLRREMTKAEIKAENLERIEEGFDAVVEKGDLISGFTSEEEVIRYGIKAFLETFDSKDCCLLKGDGGCLSAQPLLCWPKEHDKAAERINALAEEWNNIGGYGYSFVPNGKARDEDERAEEIDSEWLALMKEISPETYGAFK